MGSNSPSGRTSAAHPPKVPTLRFASVEKKVVALFGKSLQRWSFCSVLSLYSFSPREKVRLRGYAETRHSKRLADPHPAATNTDGCRTVLKAISNSPERRFPVVCIEVVIAEDVSVMF